MSDYKRLTKKFENGYIMADCTNCPSCDKCDDRTHYCQTTIKERLAELEDKIENGTLIELPKKCYQVIWVLDWEILEYDIVKIKYDHMEGIVSVEATRPHTIEYFTKDNRYKGRVLGVDVLFTKPEAEAKLKELKENNNG